MIKVAILVSGNFSGTALVDESLLDLNPEMVDLTVSEVYVSASEGFPAVVGKHGETHNTLSPATTRQTTKEVPDGMGGWMLPSPLPEPDTAVVAGWKLKTLLAEKGLEFSPADAVVAVRWKHEPSFAIDGAVAKALQASLGYDDAQLQALFNEAAALK